MIENHLVQVPSKDAASLAAASGPLALLETDTVPAYTMIKKGSVGTFASRLVISSGTL